MGIVELRRDRCLLCGAKLTRISESRQKHPHVDTCLVRFTDIWGVAAEPEVIEPEEEIPLVDQFIIEGMEIFPRVEEVLEEIFAAVKLPRLGGKSTGRGWSSVSLFQRCKYAWKRRHIDKQEYESFVPGVESAALAIGTIVHTFLAVYYTRMIVPDYPLTPNGIADALTAKANPVFVQEAWRVFLAYTLYYQYESIMPLAVEYDLKDPRTGESCRYDLIAYFPEDEEGSGKRLDGLIPGTYQIEHKTSGRFDDATLNGWSNDGEVLGQMMLWDRLGLDKRFGPIQGAIVNILGKQKDIQFHRTIVAPGSWLKNQHTNDLKLWEAEIKMAIATKSFPRSRGNCIGRYGKCFQYEHCASSEDA